jgi:hypothetical protein
LGKFSQPLATLANQSWYDAAARTQACSDRGIESRHNLFTSLCGSQAQNN